MTAKNNNNNGKAGVTKAAVKAGDWDAIVALTLEPYDLEDTAQRYAVAEWQKYVAKERDGEPFGELVHQFNSADVTDVAKVARRVYNDNEIPKPVRFLAGIALKSKKAENHLPKHWPMRFAAGGSLNANQ